MADKDQYRGMSPQQVENQKPQPQEGQQGQQQNTDEFDQQLDNKKQQAQAQQPEGGQQSQESQAAQQQEGQKSGEGNSGQNELEQYRNLAKNTFGLADEEINEKTLKMAKSYANLQSTATKTKDELSQVKQEKQRLEQQAQQQKQQPAENSNQEPNSGQPTTRDNSDVDEKTLINQGYLNQQDLDGLTDLEKERAVVRAQIQYDKDKSIEDYKNSLEKVEQEKEQERTQQQIKQENARRANDDFDRLVKQGVNIAELSEDEWNGLKAQMQYIRDPQNPNLIKENALELAAYAMGYMPNGTQPEPQNGNQQQTLRDTGFNANKRQSSNTDESVEEQLSKKAKDRYFSTVRDPKSQFRQG